jgi:hypothetical protein
VQPIDYARATAIITSATLKMSIEHSWPHLQEEDREAMFIDILDRMARIRGWSLRREPVMADEEAGE